MPVSKYLLIKLFPVVMSRAGFSMDRIQDCHHKQSNISRLRLFTRERFEIVKTASIPYENQSWYSVVIRVWRDSWDNSKRGEKIYSTHISPTNDHHGRCMRCIIYNKSFFVEKNALDIHQYIRHMCMLFAISWKWALFLQIRYY